MNIPSTLTGGHTTLIQKIAVKPIVENWAKDGIDVDSLFNGLSEIELRECNDTGYRFFFPLDLGGDDVFYQALQKYPWYYPDWKWEYDQALVYVLPGMRILEIGCGKGGFLTAASSKGAETVGLEYNSVAVEKCRALGLDIHQESIEAHALGFPEHYDLVCSFQVMEHIATIKEAITASVAVLKPGGLLIISVPNNSAFIRHDPLNLLNTPPHHVGLWSESSLSKLPKFFPLSLIRLKTEPLQTYHLKYFYQVMLGGTIEKIFGKMAFKINMLFRYVFLHLGYRPWFRNRFKGHTVLAVYKKFDTK